MKLQCTVSPWLHTKYSIPDIHQVSNCSYQCLTAEVPTCFQQSFLYQINLVLLLSDAAVHIQSEKCS